MNSMTDISELLQLIRTLRTSQVRKQLEYDCNADPDTVTGAFLKDRYAMVISFFHDAKEQL
jgi:hypothetical protein